MTTTTTTGTGSIPIIDSDSHLIETPDLWTSRLPTKWHDVCPRVEVDDRGREMWRIGQRWCYPVALTAPAGADEHPECWVDVDEAVYEPHARLRWMDAHSIYAQVLYPNVLAFEGHAVMALDDPELALACVRANNDHFADFCSAAPDRLVPIAMLPFWDIDESIKEMERCAAQGHRGVIWAATLAKHGLPATTDRHWDRFYGAAQEMGQSINFHIGVGFTAGQSDVATKQTDAAAKMTPLEEAADETSRTALSFMANGRTIADVIMSGLCDRFPELNIVSVESGYGYLPYLVEALDWQWRTGFARKFPERLLPSEYFRRQVYAMFWFEKTTLPLLDLYPDNVLFETDYPHPTSLTPGENPAIPEPADLAAEHTERFGEDLMRKVLWENAARLYRIDAPPGATA